MKKVRVSFIIILLVFSCKKSTDPLADKDAVTDFDGNIYHTVRIGTQVWTVENLKVTHYRNGVGIQNVTDDTVWNDLTSGAYCNYDNNAKNVATYGRLYNWFAVNDSQNLAPPGWHIACDQDWQVLVNYLGGSFYAGGKLKETGTTHWRNPNTGATNESGFTALPAGERFFTGEYSDLGYSANFWSASNAGDTDDFILSWRLEYQSAECVLLGMYYPQFGFSVRCVKD